MNIQRRIIQVNISLLGINDPKEKLPYEGKIVKRFTREYAYYLGVSKYFVFNIRQPLWFRKREEQVFLETWHGTPLKRLAFDQEEVTAASPPIKLNFIVKNKNGII